MFEADFSPYIAADEELLWQGESHKEGPAPQASGSNSMLLFAVIWTVMTVLIFGIVFISSGNELRGGTMAAAVIGAAVFIGLGAWLFYYTFHFTHEYYALTDKRFLRMSDKGEIVQQSELYHAVSAELLGIKNGYGTIKIKTGVVHRLRVKGHTHTTREFWAMRGIEGADEFYKLFTGLLQIIKEEQHN
ncbi:MAG: hypothetical protein IKP95_07450 [Ruminococcus sp.]|nr:hypothetical protein [Ruminococcus sp.]